MAEPLQPEAFTHGSSVDRVKWFKTGFASGKLPAAIHLMANSRQ
ncbi:neutral zinc metallopeptidase [Shewanella seohaensis]|nr:neutral zinc metallopeptidase [Shewanella seohaensis]UXM83976.1 neutral zinc metallopeptidase [Shewanella seohaensis]